MAAEPEIPAAGYLVEEIDDGLHYVTEGTYQVLFSVTDEGVVVVDAPPTMAEAVLAAIADVTDRAITHVVYTHAHADHIGAAVRYPDDATYVGHAETAARLERAGDPNRPVPDVTFEESHTLRVGGETLRLDHHGTNHSADTVFVYAPEHATLMLVDVVFPGWIPSKDLAAAESVPGHVAAHDHALKYDFKTFVGGHLGRLGDRDDVRESRAYVRDLRENTTEALETIEIGPIAATVGENRPWKLFDTYFDAVADRAAAATLETWGDRLGGAEVFVHDNATAMAASLQIDDGVLGPLGLDG
jgi:glyoxylase-like metal-dependent hydrolase (beta-lactamase superfamily II)